MGGRVTRNDVLRYLETTPDTRANFRRPGGSARRRADSPGPEWARNGWR